MTRGKIEIISKFILFPSMIIYSVGGGEESNLKRTSNHLGGDLSTINNKNQTLTDSLKGIKRTDSER